MRSTRCSSSWRWLCSCRRPRRGLKLAQIGGGEINGLVIDGRGRVPGGTVTVTNSATGVARPTIATRRVDTPSPDFHVSRSSKSC
jgi:hypothetical protein